MKKLALFSVTLIGFWVILASVPCLGIEPVRKTAERFFSDGDLINGWYWLRDSSFEHVAEWVFEGISPGTEDLVLDLEVLATDRVDGPRGIDARFFLSYGIPPTGTMGGLIVGTKEITLPNVSPPSDPVGYTCRGQVVIPRANLENATALWIRAHRAPGPFLSGKSPSTVHVAFRRESVVLLSGVSPTPGPTFTPYPTPIFTPFPTLTFTPYPTPGPTSTFTPPPGTQFVEPDADQKENALLVEPGTCTGNLGYQREDNSRDHIDWYRFRVEEGQRISLTLTVPQNASFSLSLYPPGSENNVGSVTVEGTTKTLEYVVSRSGDWFVSVYRRNGEGDYSLRLGTGGVAATPKPTLGPTFTPSPTPIFTPRPTPTLTPYPTPTFTPSPTPTLTPTPTAPPTPPPDLSTPPPFAGYRITVVTGDVFGAGTDANVYIKLYGEKGESGRLKLDMPNRNDFERGQTDVFTIHPTQVRDLGAIRQIYLYHDNTGLAPGWFVVSVTVENVATGQKYFFFFNRWFATDEGDGSLGALENAAGSGKQTFTPPYADTRVWTHELLESKAKASANKESGGIAFYIDALAGAATATAGQSIWVYTPQATALTVEATIRYVGGTMNVGLASFSSLRIFCEANGELILQNDISPAFSGTVIFTKVMSLALLAAGGLAPKNAKDIVDLIKVGYDLYKLNSALQQLEQAGNLKTERLRKTFRSKAGWNKISVGLRGDASGAVTGSAFVIVGGQVTSIDVTGLP